MNPLRLVRIVALLAAGTFVFAACSSGSSSSSSSTTSTTKAVTKQPNSLLGATEIKALQTDLTKVGCFTGTADGIIGPVTRSAIEAFQTASSLTADGEYGPATKQKLSADVAAQKKVCATTPVQPATTGPPCTSAAILAALPEASAITDFGCNGSWAWAGIDVNPNQGGYEATELLKANGSVWVKADRTTACVPASNIPAEVYNPGCTTN